VTLHLKLVDLDQVR